MALSLLVYIYISFDYVTLMLTRNMWANITYSYCIVSTTKHELAM